MRTTEEQEAIISSKGSLRINAVAGAGKTTTIIEYASRQPSSARILYLVFNKSVKSEAVKKFEKRGLKNVRVETAHSLAWRFVVAGKGWEISKNGYSSHELVKMLKIPRNHIQHGEYIIASHVLKLVTLFCNSDKDQLQEVKYAERISDPQAKSFAQQYSNQIHTYAKRFFMKMDCGEIPMIHDYYLKKFQLMKPKLPYEYILFDEGQDASAAMLDIFLAQEAVKVIVGDSNQQIYSWRFAVNSLDKVDFRTMHLSNSFRFDESIAGLARHILRYKENFNQVTDTPLHGKGKPGKIQSRAILARTNLGLLLKAIEFVTETTSDNRLHFEGNLQSYTYADEGASLYDVLHLYNGKRHLIKDPVIASMQDLRELDDYIRNTEDAQLGMMLEIVREHGNYIPGILQEIKSRHTERESATMIFSTVHRSKGMEYDSVQLVNDFITASRIEKILNSKEASQHHQRINEEINLLYVAITRAKSALYIPEELLPAGYEPEGAVKVIKSSPPSAVKTAGSDTPSIHLAPQFSSHNASFDLESNERAIKKTDVAPVLNSEASIPRLSLSLPWTKEQDEELLRLFESGVFLRDIARHFNRSLGGVTSRLKYVSRRNNDRFIRE